MNYNYKTKEGKTVRVFYNEGFRDKEDFGTMSWFEGTDEDYREKEERIQKDQNGKLYFCYNGEKIFVENFEAYTPEGLIKNLNEVYAEDLCHTLIKYGMDSLRVMMKVKKLDIVDMGAFGRVAFSTSSNFDDPENYTWIEYKFVKEYLHNPEDCYKLRLRPANEEDQGVYPSEDYYVRDLIGLLKACKDNFQLTEKKKSH